MRAGETQLELRYEQKKQRLSRFLLIRLLPSLRVGHPPTRCVFEVSVLIENVERAVDGVSLLGFLVAFFAVAECEAGADGHESYGG